MATSSREGVLLVAPVPLSARQAYIPIFDSPTRARPFHAALPPARRAAYDRTARLLLVSALLAEQHRAAHALWTGGVPVPRADAIPCQLNRDLESVHRWEGNPEQAWYNAVEARLCLAVLDLVIIAAATPAIEA
ncbi:hypothetical protein B0H17DRAFT_1203637 [Mycena rosella]|uniref:Uncharacterized protein n=1 Tax=Mycena rosella TaxID=1033263 RepID=A0AAD7DB23_MYCRO|nr:hypothetical protein B0H17DRAFT_1213221 [Mycena rosella]KAJ7687395.1 hypothetical protein B0H17DRAFT_1203637 [Mycena rosella]